MKKYIDRSQATVLNRAYIEHAEDEFGGKVATEYFALLNILKQKNFIEFNESGNIIQKTLTNDRLQAIAYELNNKLGKKKYSISKILKMAKNAFNLYKKENKILFKGVVGITN